MVLSLAFLCQEKDSVEFEGGEGEARENSRKRRKRGSKRVDTTGPHGP